MDFSEIYNVFNELKTLLEEKKQAIIKKNIEKLNSIDEECVVLCTKISKFNFSDQSNDFTSEQKEKLKNIGQEIKKLEENNEILIKHSLDVINNILSGILNIVQNDKSSYNSKGVGCQDSESLDISSITEEA